MERTGFGGTCRCSRSERTEKVWVKVDLAGAGGNLRSLSECVCGGTVYIRAVVHDGRRDQEICGQGRNRAEAIATGLRRYLL